MCVWIFIFYSLQEDELKKSLLMVFANKQVSCPCDQIYMCMCVYVQVKRMYL